MAFKFLDRVQMSVTGAPGVGNITVATALNGYQSFTAAGLSNGDTTPYLLLDGSAWEIGTAVWSSSGGTLARTLTRSSTGSLINASSKSVVAATLRAEDLTTGSLANLSDVDVTEGAGIDGWSLTWVNVDGKWKAVDGGGGGGASSLAGLSDVTLTSPSDNQFLQYSSSASKWENKTLSLATVATTGAYSDLTGPPSIPTNGSFNLASLGDVVITSLADTQVLAWDSTSSKWKNVSAGGGGGGGSLVTLSDVSITTGSGIDGYVVYWNNSASKFEAKSPAGSGAVAPTIVQSICAIDDTNATFTFGSAPSAGNALVAIVSHFSAGSFAAGWQLVAQNRTASLEYVDIFVRMAGPSEPTSQTLMTSINACSISAWELSGASGSAPGYTDILVDQTGTAVTVHQGAAAASLVLGHFSMAQATTTELPTLSGGVSADSTATAPSGSGSGYGRSVASFHESFSSAGGVSATATYAHSQDANAATIMIAGA